MAFYTFRFFSHKLCSTIFLEIDGKPPDKQRINFDISTEGMMHDVAIQGKTAIS